uniref:Uncharacterized protein n=1 Tax=Cannabis sativa TaxID=3483 RepID=A0A803QHR1_CANSA
MLAGLVLFRGWPSIGPTRSGRPALLRKLVFHFMSCLSVEINKLEVPTPEEIKYFYGVNPQPMRTNCKNIGFYKLESGMGQSQASKEVMEIIALNLAKVIIEATKDDKLMEANWALRHSNPLMEEEDIFEQFATAYPDKGAFGANTSERDHLKYLMKDYIDRENKIVRSLSNPESSLDTIRVDPFVTMSFCDFREYEIPPLMKAPPKVPSYQAPIRTEKALVAIGEVSRELVVSRSGKTQVRQMEHQALMEASLAFVAEGATQDNVETTIVLDESLDGPVFPKKGVLVTIKCWNLSPQSEREAKKARFASDRQRSLGEMKTFVDPLLLRNQLYRLQYHH